MSKQYMMQNLHEFYLQPNVACTINAVSEYKVSEFNATLHPHIKIYISSSCGKVPNNLHLPPFFLHPQSALLNLSLAKLYANSAIGE